LTRRGGRGARAGQCRARGGVEGKCAARWVAGSLGIRVWHGRRPNEYAIAGWGNLWSWNLSRSGEVVPCAGLPSLCWSRECISVGEHLQQFAKKHLLNFVF